MSRSRTTRPNRIDATDVRRALDDPRDLVENFSQRNWFPPALAELDLVRVTPLPDSDFVWPRWWPRLRASRWRIVMRQYNAAGRLRLPAVAHQPNERPNETPTNLQRALNKPPNEEDPQMATQWWREPRCAEPEGA